MKTIAEIQQQIIDAKTAQPELAGLNSTSKTAVWRLWTYLIASIAWLQYKAWEVFASEMDETIAAQKLYTLRWWQQKVLSYRHGQDLDTFGSYSDAGLSPQDIAQRQVVKSAAVRVVTTNNVTWLLIKAAKQAGGKLQPLSIQEKSGLEAYINDIKPAGTGVEVFTGNADKLQLSADFYYNPLVLDSAGKRIDGTDDRPVLHAVRSYLQNLAFDGVVRVSDLADILQGVSGCANRQAYVRRCATTYETPKNFTDITAQYVSVAGYMDIDEDDFSVNYISG